MRRVAIAAGILSGLAAIPALGLGLLWLLKSPFLGLLLLGLGVLAMEGGVYLIRHAGEPSVLSLNSPVVSGAISVAGLGLGMVAAVAGAQRAPAAEPAWLKWVFYALAALGGWIGIRAGRHATKPRGPA